MKRNQAQKFIVLFLLFLFAYSWRVEAQTGKEKQITMEFKNEGLPSIFKRFEKVSGYKVLFIYDEISSYTSTGKVEKATVDEALRVIIGKNPLKYHIDGQFINITQKDSKKFFSQVKGKVLSEEDGLPVVSATIIVEDPSNIRTITDNNGNFQLSDVPKDSRVRISYVGLETQFLHPSSYMSVVMKSDTRALDEVVVTGMFNRKKEGFTGSAVTIKGEDLKKYSTNNVAKAIAAVAPGLRIVDNINMGSNPNGLPDMRMRGSANMDMGTQSVDFNSTSNDVLAVQGEYETYANQPLLIMDGFEISIQTLADMDPDRVASIVLLKDAAATAIYGSRAANGVIVIESKTPKPGRIWVTYGGELRIEAPDMTGYNLMNAREKIDAELKSGLYTYGGETVEKWQLYQSKLREVLAGVNTYWLDKPLQTAFQQRHTVTLEGGDEALRYRMYVGYNSSPGVMKDSKRDVLTGSLDFQYRLKKVLLKNSITLDNSVANESPWGSFSEYTRLNPYLRPYGENGEIQKRLDNFEGVGGESSYLNPMYNTTFNSKDQSKNFTVRELFKVEYNPTNELRFEGAFNSLQTAFQQRHTVTLEGGDEALRYRMYVGYNSSPGVMKDSKRDVLTGSLDFQYRLKKVLLKNSITLDNSVANESPWGSFSEYTRLNPYLRPYGENGEIQKRLDNFEGVGGESSYLNPMYNTTFNSKDQSKNFTVRELFKVEYNPTNELRFEGAFNLSKSVGHRDIFRPAQHTLFDNVTDPTLRGDYRRSQSEAVSWGIDLTGSWNKQLKDHYLTANARMSVLENNSETYGNYVTGFPNDNMDNLLFGKKYNEKVTGDERTTRSIGWVAAGGYSYKYKYSFDFNIRLDGSSQFGKNNRWAPFWSTGLRWDLKKENFMKDVSFISDFILRSTYGTTGSQGFDPYQAHGYYTYSNLLLPYYSSDATGSEILAMHNESLKWQTTKSTNLALELGFLDQRLTARVEYYRKITDNMVTSISLAPSLGFGSYPENLGKIENKGWEISLSAIPYKNTAKQAYWTITVNGSRNTDKLLEISEAMKHRNDMNASNLTDTPLPRYEEGESLSRIWVVRSLGIDPASGDEILLKRNGEMTSAVNWSANDVVPIGNTEPTWQGYINSSFTYKGWGADVSFRYQFGGQVYNQTLLDKVENANLKYNVDRRVSQLRWAKPGDKAQFRTLTPSGWETKATSRFIMDENIFQGSSLSVYYRMDRTNTKFISHWGLSSAKVTFNMEDFFYWSTVKRERGLYYPYSRQFTFALNVAF